jgi:hypothetical protein
MRMGSMRMRMRICALCVRVCVCVAHKLAERHAAVIVVDACL